MSLLTIPYPAIDPVLFEFGPFSLRWYGITYMAALVFAWLYVRALLKNAALWPRGQAPLASNYTDDLFLWCVLGAVGGGRLGYVLFYDPAYFIANPLSAFAIWEGGMSFHGGLIGVIVAVYVFSARHAVRMLTVADMACAATPMGLFFGRIGNFINAELYGRVSDVPWAMVFPGAGPEPRHPSQIYAALLEGLLLFLLCRYLTHRRGALHMPGLVTGVFFAGYGAARIFVEFFRLPDPDHVLTTAFTTPGMIYSLPMVALGLYLIWRAVHRPPVAA